MSTGALHTKVTHNYGKEAFLLQYDHFVAFRDSPQKVVSDRGSQLTTASWFVTWTKEDSPTNMGWYKIAEQGAHQGTAWQFVPAGCQYSNGLAESRVKANKLTMDHLLMSMLINSKPTLTYAQLNTLLAGAALIVDERW